MHLKSCLMSSDTCPVISINLQKTELVHNKRNYHNQLNWQVDNGDDFFLHQYQVIRMSKQEGNHRWLCEYKSFSAHRNNLIIPYMSGIHSFLRRADYMHAYGHSNVKGWQQKLYFIPVMDYRSLCQIASNILQHKAQ